MTILDSFSSLQNARVTASATPAFSPPPACRHRPAVRITIVLLFVASLLNTLQLDAQTTVPSVAPATHPATRPAILNLIIPDEATVTIDDQPATQKTIQFDQIKVGETIRISVKAKFPGGTEERLVDLEEGQTIPVAIGPPQPDKAVTVALQGVDPILALALSPDGRYLVVGLDSSAMVAWDLIAGRPVRTFQKHRGPVQTLAFSPDGMQLLSGSGDNTAMLWDFASGEVIQTYKGHTDQVMSVAFSPDGQRVLTGSMDKTAIVWNASTGQKLTTVVGHTDQIFGVCFSPDGKTVGTAALDRTGALWEADTAKLLLVLRGHPDGVSCITFSPDGKTVCTGSFDNSAMFWDAATGKRLRQTGKHEIDIYGITYTPDGTKLLTAARDECVMMWDTATGKKLRVFLGHNSDVGAAVVTRDARLMFSCSRDGMVKLWDMATGMELASLVSDASRQSWAVVAPDGLFDASEPGRRMMGFRFTTLPGGSLDQFFNERYHPGLLSEIYTGRRPFSAKPLGHTLPPMVKITSPKNRSAAATPRAAITIEASEQGHGGISAITLYNNGTPIAEKKEIPTTPDGKALSLVFDDVPLAPGANQLRVQASNRDGSWQTSSPEIEVNYAGSQRTKGRLYVLSAAISEYENRSLGLENSVREVAALTELLRTRAARLFDRIDVIRLANRDATASQIEESLSDIASIAKPQDSIIVLVSGRGLMSKQNIALMTYETRDGRDELSLEALAAALRKAPALKRALIMDISTAGDAGTGILAPTVNLTIAGGIERISRENGVYIIAKLLPSLSSFGSPKPNQDWVIPTLLSAAQKGAPRAMDSSGAVDLMEWFHSAARQCDAFSSSQAKAFPIFAGEKPSTDGL